jgi:hypothetical protein
MPDVTQTFGLLYTVPGETVDGAGSPFEVVSTYGPAQVGQVDVNDGDDEDTTPYPIALGTTAGVAVLEIRNMLEQPILVFLNGGAEGIPVPALGGMSIGGPLPAAPPITAATFALTEAHAGAVGYVLTKAFSPA